MAKKKIPKSRKRRLLFIGTACIIAFVFFCVNAFTYTYKIITLTKQQNNLVANLDELKDTKEELETQINHLQTPEGLADYARKEYFYTREGEYVIRKIDDESNNETSDENNSNLNQYQNYIIVSIGAALIFIIFIRKRK